MTIGLDITKSVFQVHAEDASRKRVMQRGLRARQVAGFFAKQLPCVVGIEACGWAHHWERTLRVLGHDVRLIPAGQALRQAQQDRCT
jgi:transposase